tara:strand:- start:126 stop:500 length:375 start_codon:yes stop_codon:yes gene_type:complete
MISDIHYLQRPIVFNQNKAEAGKENGMHRVDENANEEFRRVALKTILTYARNKPYITANDIWESLDLIGITTHDNRALGPLFKKAARNKWIEKTNQTMRSVRSTRHSGDVRVWRSLIFGSTIAA